MAVPNGQCGSAEKLQHMFAYEEAINCAAAEPCADHAAPLFGRHCPCEGRNT